MLEEIVGESFHKCEDNKIHYYRGNYAYRYNPELEKVVLNAHNYGLSLHKTAKKLEEEGHNIPWYVIRNVWRKHSLETHGEKFSGPLTANEKEIIKEKQKKKIPCTFIAYMIGRSRRPVKEYIVNELKEKPYRMKNKAITSELIEKMKSYARKGMAPEEIALKCKINHISVLRFIRK